MRSMAVAVLATLSITALAGAPILGQVLPPNEGAVVLAEARSGHSATLLADDHLVLAGGSDGQTELASVEVVDPVGMTVESLGSLVVARSGHTATMLSDGRVLVAGGRSAGTRLADAELFDPVSGQSEPTGPMKWPRADHDALPLTDGRVLIVGGIDGGRPVARAELFDPAAGTFTPAGKSRATHQGAAAALLPDGRVLLTGAPTKKKASPAELYDPARDKWSPIKGGGKFQEHVALTLDDGRVLLAGGTSAASELFDPARGKFSKGGPMAEPRSGSTATLLPDGHVLFAGGANAGFELAGLESWDPASGTFETTGEMLIPRIGHTAAALSDGRVLLAGGTFAGLALDDLLVYDPSDGSLLTLDLAVEAEPGSEDSRTPADVRAELGPPDAFALYFYDEITADGKAEPVRLEQWSYYGHGLELTIADGHVIGTEPLVLEGGAVAESVPYDPDAFSAYMSLDEVLASAGLEEYIGGRADELVEGGELFFGDRLTWGMKAGELRYLEALALAAEEPSAEAD